MTSNIELILTHIVSKLDVLGIARSFLEFSTRKKLKIKKLTPSVVQTLNYHILVARNFKDYVL